MDDIQSQDIFIQASGARLFARRLTPPPSAHKSPPTLVFLHDALGCVELWRDFPLRIAAETGCPALIYDRQGSGKSDSLSGKRDRQYLHDQALTALPEVLRQCGVQEAILIGHSDGGSIALLYASAHQRQARAVVTEAAHVFVEEITLAGIREAVIAYQKSELKQKLARYHGEKTEALFRAWQETWLDEQFRDWNIEAYLPQIRCPLLAIQGADDEYGSPAQLEAIAARVSGPVKPLLLPDCGHFPHRQAEDTVLAEMVRFIQRTL